METPFLIGDRIYLRPLDTEADLDRCLRWINDPEVSATLGRHHPIGRVAERDWLEEQYKSDTQINLAIVVKDADRHIGNCGFNTIDYVNRNAVFGILIGEKEAWGHGYGPEAARLLLKYGFEELGLHRIGLEVYAHNARAIRAYEKAGFVREGVLRESYFRSDSFHDTILMSVLESEWRKTCG
jgi:RimJ/RimL family protein N-acetyltransferase